MMHESHLAHARRDIKKLSAKLYVITVLNNPLRWRSRYKNYHDFHCHVTSHGAELITVELAQGDREHEITEIGNPRHVQLRIRDEMFHKENLQNIGARALPADAEYVAFIDADMIFTRPDWVQETLHQLQHYDIVQMFSSFTDLLPDHRTGATHPGFMWAYFHRPELLKDGCYGSKWLGSPGGAWAYRIGAYHRLGGLLDRCILGSADTHMAYGLVQREFDHGDLKHGSPAYKLYVRAWQANAAQLRENIGYVEAHMIHKWHGPRAKRGYSDRWKIMERNHYDPYIDIVPDAHGVYQFSGNKPRLRDEVRHYLRSRDEDSNACD